MLNDYFIVIYTHAVKAYCDAAFFENVHALSNGRRVHIIDNTPGNDYFDRLNTLFHTRSYTNFELSRLSISAEPVESRFQRHVCDSVNHLRSKFLQDPEPPFFLILESDVIPPTDLLHRFDRVIAELDSAQPDWGIIGGLYYEGFHRYDFDTSTTSLERTAHCLSGCTVYRRSLLEKYPFRYDPANLGPFPDAWICFDAGREYSLWNDHRIRCAHLHNPVNGLRVS